MEKRKTTFAAKTTVYFNKETLERMEMIFRHFKENNPYVVLNLSAILNEGVKLFCEKHGLNDRENQILKMGVDELDLSIRSMSILKHNKIATVGDLVGMSQVDLMRIPNSGRKMMNEIISVLTELNIPFKSRGGR